MPDGRFMMIYKGVSTDGELPKGGAVVCGTAFSDKPDSGFVKTGKPIMVNPTNGWSVEDPFIWCENGRFYALVKDFQGYFTHTERSATALFESESGIDWTPSDHPLAYECELSFETERKKVYRLERPQIFLRTEKPSFLSAPARSTTGSLMCSASGYRCSAEMFSFIRMLYNENILLFSCA